MLQSRSLLAIFFVTNLTFLLLARLLDSISTSCLCYSASKRNGKKDRSESEHFFVLFGCRFLVKLNTNHTETRERNGKWCQVGWKSTRRGKKRLSCSTTARAGEAR